MARDAEATRARILSAAVAEFSASGLAGGRIDRIAAEAGANVRMIYAYFGSKSELFDACFRHVIRRMAAEVPPRASELPEWAADLVEYHARHPEALRISMWAQLERTEPADEPLEDYATKVAALAEVASPPLTGTDVLVIVYAIAQSWQLAPAGLVGAASGSADDAGLAARRGPTGDPVDADTLELRRRAARAAVERLLR